MGDRRGAAGGADRKPGALLIAGCAGGGYEVHPKVARRMAYVANGRETPPADLVSYKKLRDIKQRVGIAIMRACAQAVIKGFEGSPHAALTAVNRYQGLRGRRRPPAPVRYGPLPQMGAATGAAAGGTAGAAAGARLGVRIGARA